MPPDNIAAETIADVAAKHSVPCFELLPALPRPETPHIVRAEIPMKKSMQTIASIDAE